MSRDGRFKDPMTMTPRERRRRIVELLAIGLGRLAAEQRDRTPPPAPSEKGLDSSGKGR